LRLALPASGIVISISVADGVDLSRVNGLRARLLQINNPRGGNDKF
jgi:hypothetical protein